MHMDLITYGAQINYNPRLRTLRREAEVVEETEERRLQTRLSDFTFRYELQAGHASDIPSNVWRLIRDYMEEPIAVFGKRKNSHVIVAL